MRKTDVFLCYRRPGAQTAKLFKRYLTENGFSGVVWYSDSEPTGNYKTDIGRLVDEAECAVLFIDPNFTKNFLERDARQECITALEIIEIAKKCERCESFQLFTVFLDRPTGFTEKESEELETLFEQGGLANPKEAVLFFAQNNAVFFATATDDENALFRHMAEHLLPNDFYKNNRSRGNFYFGKLPTYVDIMLWDSKNGIDPNNICFLADPKTMPLYDRITRFRSNLEYEVQNNHMISILGADTILSDNDEQKLVDIRYRLIEYRLFYKTIQLWEQLGMDQILSGFDWKTDIYPIPNAMGLAFMVVTSDNQLIFTRRSPERKIRPNEYDCSIVEGLKKEGTDRNKQFYSISDEGYLHNEIVRAFCEEVCDTREELDIKVTGLVLDKEYGQWNLIGTIHTGLSSDEIRRLHALRDDTYEKNHMEFVPFTDAQGARSLEVLRARFPQYLQGKIWGMALATVYATLLDVGFSGREIDALSNLLC